MPFDEQYFSSHTYQNVAFTRFSQYWWSNRFYAILARRLGSAGGRLLEIGAGLGHLVGQLEPAFTTTALDVNPWALQKTKQVAQRTGLLAGSAEALPFLTGAFDVVIIKHVVEHLEDPVTALAEIRRITGPGGILIFATPNLSSLLKPCKGDKWIGFQDPTHISLREPEEWLFLIQKAGFSVITLFSDGFWDVPYIRWLPKGLQKVLFGSLGGLQAVLGIPFLPLRWGESMIVIARKGMAG